VEGKTTPPPVTGQQRKKEPLEIFFQFSFSLVLPGNAQVSFVTFFKEKKNLNSIIILTKNGKVNHIFLCKWCTSKDECLFFY
jgi:hypothetical protein